MNRLLMMRPDAVETLRILVNESDFVSTEYIRERTGLDSLSHRSALVFLRKEGVVKGRYAEPSGERRANNKWWILINTFRPGVQKFIEQYDAAAASE